VDSLKAEKCLYFVLADPTKTGIPTDTKEKWMDAEYSIKAVSRAHMVAWNDAAPIPAIQFPPPNPYLPKALGLVPGAEKETEDTPVLLSSGEGSQIYHAQDCRYKVPEVSCLFSFQSPLLNNTAKSQALSDLYVRALSEKLSATLSLASSAGISTHFGTDDFKLNMGLSGYNDKAPLLLNQIFASFKNIAPSQEEFEIYRTSLSSDYDNSSKELPVRQAMQQLDGILFNKPTELEKLAVVKEIYYEEFKQFSKELFQTTFTEGMIYGNMDRHDAQMLWSNLARELSSEPFLFVNRYKKKVLVLSDKYGPYKIVQPTQRQGSGVLLLLQEGPFSFEHRSIQQVLGYALSDAFFDTLRTKQQTAYIAKAWNTEEERQLMQFFAVQSSTHTPSDLLARFELFLESFDKNLSVQIPEGRFESIRASLITLLKMPPENMPGMAGQLNELAFEYKDFKWIDKRIESMKNLNYDKFCEISHQLLSRNNPRRLAILMEGVITPENDFHYELVSKEDARALGSFISVK
jgi:insulysin